MRARRVITLNGALLLSLVLLGGSQNDFPRTDPSIDRRALWADSIFASHPPIRDLPPSSTRPIDKGPAFFVDPGGHDAHDGSESRPWKTLRHAIGQLRPGHTLYLRGGIYWAYGQVKIGPENSGRPGAPVTIRSYPGELAIVDFGYPEFFEDPAHAWLPYPEGAEGEYVSTRTYRDLTRDVSGNFGDSMVPLFRYMFHEDFRSENEHMRPGLGNRQRSAEGLYAGPGLFGDPATGRFHIRLRHTNLPSRGEANYRGETDPRKIPLVIHQGGDGARFRLEDAHDVRILDLVIRGSDRGTVSVSRSRDIHLEGLWIYGGTNALDVHGTDVRVLHTKVRGFDAPWHSRFHDKNRSDAGRLATFNGANLEIAYNEFTDHHDGIYFKSESKTYGDLEFHHNLVSNMNDDCLFSSGKRATGVWWIYQNVVSGCTTALAHSSGDPAIVPEDGAGNYVFRNVFDLRRHPYQAPPGPGDTNDDGTRDSKLAGEHSNPSFWPAYYFYHNTVISWNGPENGPTYGLEMGQNTQHTIRRVFNNIFFQIERRPGQRLPAIDDDFEAGGNLFWSLRPEVRGGRSGNARAGGRRGRTADVAGGPWGGPSGDVHADPRFLAFTEEWRDPTDFGLRAGSPAIDAGVEVPTSWPDPLRESDQGAPDIGAFPFGMSGPMPSDSVIRTADGT